MTNATRLRNLRKRVQAANEEKRLAGDKPSWSTHQAFKDGVKLFRQHVGDPAEVFGESWEDFFAPWESLFVCLAADAETLAAIKRHHAEDGGASWSFGEFVARDHIANP